MIINYKEPLGVSFSLFISGDPRGVPILGAK